MAALKLTRDNFTKEVIENKETILIDFWAEWCAPCKMMLPVVDSVSNEVKDAKICKVNVDEEPELAEAYGVMALPTFLVVRGGSIVKRMIGVQPKDSMILWLSEVEVEKKK